MSVHPILNSTIINMIVKSPKFNIRFFILITAVLLVSACTNRIYGVSEEQWLLLDKNERLETIKGYNTVEKIRAEGRVIAQQQRYEQEKQQQLQLALISAEKKQKVEDIYHGYGAWDDLVRVTIQKGRIDFNGKHKPYHPVSFSLADGEEKSITFNATGKYRYLKRHVLIAYEDGVVLFDCNNRGYSSECAQHFAYEPEWRRGKTYPHVSLHKSSKTEAKDISVIIQLIQ